MAEEVSAEMKHRVVLVCGGRDFNDAEFLSDVLHGLKPRAVVHGAARGADHLASEWCLAYGVPEIRVPAQWANLDKSAGPVRNGWMLSYTKADLVVAFPGGAGTANMVQQAKERGIAVFFPSSP